jgi:hypothetical protein
MFKYCKKLLMHKIVSKSIKDAQMTSFYYSKLPKLTKLLCNHSTICLKSFSEHWNYNCSIYFFIPHCCSSRHYRPCMQKHGHIWFCYVVYNSSMFNGFNNCTLWSIIVVITLGKCAHRTPTRQAFRSATSYVLASCKLKILYEKPIFTVEPQ